MVEYEGGWGFCLFRSSSILHLPTYPQPPCVLSPFSLSLLSLDGWSISILPSGPMTGGVQLIDRSLIRRDVFGLLKSTYYQLFTDTPLSASWSYDNMAGRGRASSSVAHANKHTHTLTLHTHTFALISLDHAFLFFKTNDLNVMAYIDQ